MKGRVPAGLGASPFTQHFAIKAITNPKSQLVDELGASFSYAYFKEHAALIHCNFDLIQELGISQPLAADMVELLLGNSQSPYSFAYNYGGHQFGNWADQLGDGRAVVIGSIGDQELQLKGSGQTPFSRRGDGQAVLRSSLREYLASEAIHCLGIPTTRALCLGSTGEKVLRDKFYDGNAGYETGAIICRTAPSFLRFGSFQLPLARGDVSQIEALIRFIGKQFYCLDMQQDLEVLALELLEQVIQRSCELVACWQAVGFTHGVLNTDNMSILGLTIDYGPFGFLERFDPKYTPNTSDLPGRRYRFEQQPAVFKWNLYRLAECFLPFVEEAKLVSLLDTFQARFDVCWENKIRERFAFSQNVSPASSSQLISRFFNQVQMEGLDFNFILRELAESCRNGDKARFNERILKHYPGIMKEFWSQFQEEFVSLHSDIKKTGQAMCQNNPRITLKNHLLALVINDVDQGNDRLLRQVFDLIRSPYDDWETFEELWAPAPPWAQSKDVQMNSCSS